MKLRTRRVLLRTLFASGVCGAVAAALAPVVAASRRPESPSPGDGTDDRAPGPVGDGPGQEPDEVLFDEMYRGRRISGGRVRAAAAGVQHPVDLQHPAGPPEPEPGPEPGAGPSADGRGHAGMAHAGAGSLLAYVDSRPLPLMRRADGSYLTMIDHYSSYPTPLAATRAAVDALGTARPARTQTG